MQGNVEWNMLSCLRTLALKFWISICYGYVKQLMLAIQRKYIPNEMLAGPGHGVARKGFIDGMNCMVLGHTSNHCHSFRIKHLALDIFKGKKKKK